MISVQAEVLSIDRVRCLEQDTVIDADAQQVARGVACQTATEAVLGIVWVADEVGDATHRAPRPVTINIVEELDEPLLVGHHRASGRRKRRTISSWVWHNTSVVRHLRRE